MAVHVADMNTRGIEMTRKDYKLITSVLRDSAWAFDDDRVAFIQDIVEDFCVVLKADSPNFKKHKFEEAVFGKRD